MRYILQKLKTFTILSVSILVFACSGYKRELQKKQIKTDNRHDFVLPHKAPNGSQLDLSFALKKTSKGKDSIRVTFTVSSNRDLRHIFTFRLESKTGNMVTQDIQFVGSEKFRKGYSSEFFVETSKLELSKIFKDKDWNVKLHGPDRYSQQFLSTKKSEKIIAQAREAWFTL